MPSLGSCIIGNRLVIWPAFSVPPENILTSAPFLARLIIHFGNASTIIRTAIFFMSEPLKIGIPITLTASTDKAKQACWQNTHCGTGFASLSSSVSGFLAFVDFQLRCFCTFCSIICISLCLNSCISGDIVASASASAASSESRRQRFAVSRLASWLVLHYHLLPRLLLCLRPDRQRHIH